MYRRNLPHWHPDGAAIFVTWRLAGTLPRSRILNTDGVPDGRAFRDMDRELDQAKYGPACLRQPSIATCVSQIIQSAESERDLCELYAFVVMPNHVHILTTPKRPLREVTKWIKGASARRANQLLGRTGERFWQDESFDHWVRNRTEFDKIERYILYNAVNAGLVEEPEQWPYSRGRPLVTG